MRMLLAVIVAATFILFHAAASPLESVSLVEDGKIHGTPAPNNVNIVGKDRIVDRSIDKCTFDKFGPNKVVVDEGNNIASKGHVTLEECKEFCDEYSGCQSFAICNHFTYNTCWFKDKRLNGSETTYTCASPNLHCCTTYFKSCDSTTTTDAPTTETTENSDATCTMEKVIRKSGPFSNEGVKVGLQFGLVSPENCEDERMVKKRCQKLSKTFYKNFRTLEGQCNHEEHPLLGSSRSRLSRLLHADYEKFRKETFYNKPLNLSCPEDDCYNECQKESDMLPNPRKLSTHVSGDLDREDTNLSLMAVFFGQFLDHDISLSPEHEVEESCCEVPANGKTKDEECYEILLPPDDPFYSSLNQSCIHLTRSEPHSSSGWPPSIKREQQNIITSFLDASNVYGSDAERSKRVRSMVKGKLQVLNDHNLLPEGNFQRCSVPIAGDVRAMENPMLASIHALFVREHNRICDQLWTTIDWTQYGNPECDNDECDELMYQNARRVLIAEWQSIIYNEWLPLILGESRISDFNLKLDSVSSYDNTTDPSTLVSFSTAAFRFGHSMVSGTFAKNSVTNGDTVKHVNLSDSFFNPDEYRENGMEMLLAGLQTVKAQNMDRFVSTELTNLLFKDTDGPSKPRFGQDLVARNIARGRDHGLQGYAKFYSSFGPQIDPNRFMKCWNHRPLAFEPTEWNLMKQIYIHPKDIDLFVGGLLEKRLPNEGILGYMFGFLVAEQFRRFKDGDRFFFTHEGNEHSLSAKLIHSIKRRRMSDLLCDNTSIRKVNTDAFLSTSNAMDCSDHTWRNSLSFEDIDLILPTKGDSTALPPTQSSTNRPTSTTSLLMTTTSIQGASSSSMPSTTSTSTTTSVSTTTMTATTSTATTTPTTVTTTPTTGLTTSCGNLLTDYYCPNDSGFKHLFNASSLEACPSECQKEGDGAVGCCEWQHDWNFCVWYANAQILQVHPSSHGYRSAVSCTASNATTEGTTQMTASQTTTMPPPEFEKVNWRFGYMNVRYVGGKNYRIWRRNLSEYIKLASNDERIVAFGMHPDQIMAAFFTYVEGSASPIGTSWPLYVRRTLNNESWTAGSYVSLGDPNINIPSPYPN